MYFQTILWDQNVRSFADRGPVVEFGSGTVLTDLNKKIAPDQHNVNIARLENLGEALYRVEEASVPTPSAAPIAQPKTETPKTDSVLQTPAPAPLSPEVLAQMMRANSVPASGSVSAQEAAPEPYTALQMQIMDLSSLCSGRLDPKTGIKAARRSPLIPGLQCERLRVPLGKCHP